MRSKCSRWVSGIGALVVLMSSAGVGLVDLAGAMPLESWDNKIPNASMRFKVLTEFNNQAVLDKETQLVWEQSPASTTTSWENARLQCTALKTGGRKGWRLPSVHELQSLIDPTAVVPLNNPTLPMNHPFSNVTALNGYWTATSDAAHPGWVWAVSFFDGSATGFILPTVNTFPSWCVRGPMNADAY
jgi:hypothetical protein